MKKNKNYIGDKDAIRVFYVTNSFLFNTGYGECMREIGNRIGKKVWLTHISQQQEGSGFKPEHFNFDVKSLYDNNVCQLQNLINSEQPDIVIIQDDTFTSVNQGLDKIDFSNTKLLYYFPHDGEQFALSSRKIVDKCDKLVAMTEFGKEKAENEGYEDIDVIYHGVNNTDYFPFDKETKKKKRQLLSKYLEITTKSNPELEDNFIIYVTGRNSLRKQPFKTFQAFNEFAKDKDDVKLIVNSINFDAFDNNYVDWIKRTLPSIGFGTGTELEDKKIILFPTGSFGQGLPIQVMADLMASSDVYFTMAWGEGFGMNFNNAFACHIPVVSFSYTTPKYIVGDKRGFLFDDYHDWFCGGYGITHKNPDIKGAVRELNKAYNAWKEGKLSTMFKDEHIKYVEENTWDKVADKWIKVIENVTRKKVRN